MKKADIFINSLIYAVYMLLSCVVVMFAEMLAVKVINLFVEIDYLSLCVIRAVIYTLGVNAILAIAAFREGYKSSTASPIPTLISGLLGALLHLIFSLLFNFAAFVSGGVRSITAIVKFGSALNSPAFSGEIVRLDFVPFFVINALIYVGVMILFNKLGASRRLSDRDELLNK